MSDGLMSLQSKIRYAHEEMKGALQNAGGRLAWQMLT